MRLLKRLGRVEAEQTAPPEQLPVSICWTSGETVTVQASALLRGQLIACDVTIHGYCGGVPEVTTAERVTRDESDIGWIFDAQGVRVGRVLSIDGRLMEWRLFEEEASRRRSATAEACGDTPPPSEDLGVN